MAKKKFYAIKKGFNVDENVAVENLIVGTWAEASKLVMGISLKVHGVAPEYQSFATEQLAKDYLSADEPFIHKSDDTYPKDCLHCYVDGSFNIEIPNYSYGLVCVQNSRVVECKNGAGKNKEALAMQQIAGELLGAMNALVFAKNNGYKKLVVFFDYKGVAYHATGYWKRDTKFNEEYYQWMQNFFKSNPDIEVIFCKVDAHNGDEFNELADGFAKLALGITPDYKFDRFIKKHGINLAS